MIIHPLKQIVSRINPNTGKAEAPKTPKQYLLLLYYLDENKADDKSFEIIMGRNETFKFLYENIDSVDLLQSHVMPQNVALDRAISTYSFMRLCLEQRMTEEEKDDIEFNEELLKEHMLNYYDLSEEQLEKSYKDDMNQ
jgi:hypothetical protein